MSAYTKIKVESRFDEQVTLIYLTNGKGNIVDNDMMQELIRAIDCAAEDNRTKAIVFSGSGDHFSFGASVPEHQKDQAAEMLSTFHSMFKHLCEAGIPTIALVRGQCLGGGMELAAFCNWVIAAENAHFGQPEIGLSVFAPVASLLLPHLVGQSAADDLLLAGHFISASRAREIGLVHSVSADPARDVDILLEQHILPKSGKALRMAVKAARYQFYQSFLRDIQVLESIYVNDLMNTHDANEGIAAFMEKRKPVWKNV
ncbi:enoyl-CoA hydratase/isomerase family protein [bacterium]|nr:enoyl-CoA hydratase/isomerase family protein [bacterium]